jgi:predicted dehydrogenase
MKTYRAAVIGLGRMGSTFDDEMDRGSSIYMPYCHTPAYVASPNVELVAGADPHEGQRSVYAERWGLPPERVYDDYRTMLEAEDLDLVSVCTNARHRPEIVEQVAMSGVRAIWAEKPMAFSLAEADRMVEVCADNSVALAVNCARRYNPHLTRASQMIQGGELGEIYQISALFHCQLSHNGSHGIDTIRYLVGGDVEWVFGEMESDEAAAREEDLSGNAYLAFDNGVRGYLRAMTVGPSGEEFDVIGSQGRFRALAGCQMFELYKAVPGGRHDSLQMAQVPFPLPLNIPGSGLTIVADLIEAAETGRPPRCSGEDGGKALEIAMALRESHRRGGVRVDLPLPDRSLRILSAETLHGDDPARVRRERDAAKS